MPLAAWAVRNLAVHGEPLLGSTAAGIIFWMGNHDGATGGIMQIPRPDAFYDLVQRYPANSVTREARAFSALAMDFIVHHPSQFAVLALVKLERFWWTITPDRLGEFAEGRLVAFLGGTVDHISITLYSKLLQLASVCLAAAGALWGNRLRCTVGERATQMRGGVRAGQVLLFSLLALFWVVHIPFISEPRYRIPIAPLLQVLEATGLVLLGDALRSLPLRWGWSR